MPSQQLRLWLRLSNNKSSQSKVNWGAQRRENGFSSVFHLAIFFLVSRIFSLASFSGSIFKKLFFFFVKRTSLRGSLNLKIDLKLGALLILLKISLQANTKKFFVLFIQIGTLKKRLLKRPSKGSFKHETFFPWPRAARTFVPDRGVQIYSVALGNLLTVQSVNDATK